jgi:hypothetical protein
VLVHLSDSEESLAQKKRALRIKPSRGKPSKVLQGRGSNHCFAQTEEEATGNHCFTQTEEEEAVKTA